MNLKCLYFSIWALAVNLSAGQSLVMLDREWTKEPVSSQFAKFNNVHLTPNRDDKDLLLAYCVHEESWWGHLRVFKHTGDKIEWAADFPKEYIDERGHYVASYDWLKLDVSKNQLLKVIESTHRGNGSLWLLELENRTFRVILQVPICGRYWKPETCFNLPLEGEASFAKMKVSFPKAPGTKHEKVVITGAINIIDMEGETQPSQPFRQECVWDSDKRVFIPQKPEATKAVE